MAGDTINEQVVGGQVETQVGLTVCGHRVEFNHVIIDFFIVGVNHVEEPRQSRHPLGLGVIFQITFRLQTQHHGDDLLGRIAKIRSQVAEIEMHLTFHVVEALQKLLKTDHRMHAIEALQTLKIIVPIIIDRHHVALTPMVDAFHAPEIHQAFVNIPIHGLQKDVDAMVIIMEGRIAIILIGTVEHHAAALVVVPEAQAVMIDGIQTQPTRHGIRQIKTHLRTIGNQNFFFRHRETR